MVLDFFGVTVLALNHQSSIIKAGEGGYHAELPRYSDLGGVGYGQWPRIGTKQSKSDHFGKPRHRWMF